ncbi:MAG TPA: ABC transporter permease, partial [Gammaproteobacteria bacterium]|nr:ABC transporter permease [Gammaproteobacteria bacterium]
ASFQILVNNLENSQQSIDDQARISLYLANTASATDIQALLSKLKAHPDVHEVLYISAEQGLQDFQKRMSGNALALLKHNPLPAVIQVFPNARKLDPAQIKALSQQFANLQHVDSAQVDILWLTRLFSIIQFVKQLGLILSVFLIFTVLIVIGNTIKLLGQDFRDEITVYKLVGATDAYVRRPFLYSGLIYGAAGSIFAICFVSLGLFWLNPEVEKLGALYQTQINLIGLNLGDILSILSTGLILGLGGAWIAGNRLIHNL